MNFFSLLYCLYFIKATKVKDLGNVSLEEEREKDSKKNIYVPNWFTVDMKTGVISSHLEF